MCALKGVLLSQRERHMNILETLCDSDYAFQLPLDDDNVTAAAADALSGVPLTKLDEGETSFSQYPNRNRWWRNKKVAVLGVLCFVVAIVLAFSMGVGVGDKEAQPPPAAGNVAIDNSIEASPTPLQRYNRLFSLILDWGATPRAVLEDVSSAPAHALHWLAYEDEQILKQFDKDISIETIRTRFVLATMYFSTHNRSVWGESSSWKDATFWLSASPVCQWYGVECLKDGSGSDSIGLITSLNLSANGLEGKLPDELSLLGLNLRTLGEITRRLSTS
jgi:hypothetical protein